MSIQSITEEIVRGIVSGNRKTDSDKRDYGDLLIFAGKEGMAGAAILAARAAMRSGAGLVHVATPKENFHMLQTSVPEAICMTEEEATAALNKFSAIAVGPGMGTDERTEKIVDSVLRFSAAHQDIPIIIDADALNVISRNKSLGVILTYRGAGINNIVITPHKREAARLLGNTNESPEIERVETCTALSKKYYCIALLKGYETLISHRGQTVWKNTTGNPGMATAGAGDVLTGIIGSLMAQGTGPIDAAAAGAFVHGRAGDIAAKKLGERSVIASDIIEALPEAFNEIAK